MKSEIISQQKNPFLEREEFIVEFICESTPTEVQILEQLGKSPELAVIRKIHTSFGQQSFIVDLVVYDNQEAKKKYLVIPKKIRKKMEEEAKAKEAEEKKKKVEEAKQKAEAEEAKLKAEEEAKEKPEEKQEEKTAEESETKPEETKEDGN